MCPGMARAIRDEGRNGRYRGGAGATVSTKEGDGHREKAPKGCAEKEKNARLIQSRKSRAEKKGAETLKNKGQKEGGKER